MTILHILAPARVGGLEQVVFNLAEGHVQAGHRVHVVAVLTHDDGGHPLVNALRDAGVTVHVAELPARSYSRERALIAQICRQIQPDVVHTHGYRPDVIDAAVARQLGIATISTVHGFCRGGLRSRFYEWLQRRSLRAFDAVVAVSQQQVTELQRAGVPQDRLHVLRNAWRGRGEVLDRAAARAALGVNSDVFHVGWVGRLSQEKGPDLLIDALARLTDLPMVVSIIGTGRDAEAVKADAAARTTADIRWHGLVPDAARLYSAFDVFVLSSRTEGTPIALLEAMAAGTPIVATAVGGVPDVVTKQEAVLVQPGDTAALADAIRAVHDDRSMGQSRAAAARTRLSQLFASEPWLSAYATLYNRLRDARAMSGAA